tara:strand:+ start:2255 stop:3082 length:828 start_codon:yes stop_codon:yes gene_type:complete
MMERIEVQISPHQASRLRNGHRVRVKPAMQGSGMLLVVSPSTFDIASRNLTRNKGVQIQLTPDEIQANREMSEDPEMEGRGIFKKIGKFIKKGAIKVGKAAGREVAKRLPELATAGLTGLAVATGQPQLIPLAGVVGSQLGKFAGKELNKAIDKPSRYSSLKKARKALAESALDDMEEGARAFGSRKTGEAKTYARSRLVGRGSGGGLYVGSGLYVGRQGSGVAADTPTAGVVGVGGTLLPPSHPALQSQAMSANFQFQHTLPPQFQVRGSGLYV